MDALPQAPASMTLTCPRCAGPMYREAADALDFVCLFCGEYRFLTPRRTSLSPALVADLAAPRRRRPRSRYWH